MKKLNSDHLVLIGGSILLLLSIYFYASGIYEEYHQPKFLTIFGIIALSALLFNIAFRRLPWFKNIMTSKYNFLTSKIQFQHIIDIQKELLFDKLIEVLKDAKFEIVNTNKEAGTIQAITKISMFSWGECIYLTLTEKGDDTVLDFISACSQVYSWGNNKRNYEKLFLEFEKSLTI